jgi:PhnB protein
MSTLSPYISFNGQCREAMTFYKNCLGGELTLMEVGGSPMEAHVSGPKDQIYHSELRAGTFSIMGTDFTDPNDGYTKGTNVSLAFACSSEDDINKFYNNLAEGGTIVMPLAKTFWADLFGGVIDKYGINWMFNYDKNDKR